MRLGFCHKIFQNAWMGTAIFVTRKAVDHIENLEEKLQKTIEILLRHDLRSAVALTFWLSQLLIQIEKIMGKKFKEHFPSFNILFLSGMKYLQAV